MADRKFIILNTTDVTSDMWADAIELESTARFNNDGSKAWPQFFTFTNRQLLSWGVKFHGLTLGKPAGDVYIDDKGMKDGNFYGN